MPLQTYSRVNNNTAGETDQLIHFCRQYGFDRFFEAFPQGYLTRLGEDGIAISGGQQQLVALARSLYRKPQFLLLDEPTAAMDRQTEQFVVSLLERLRPQIAVLLITHKPDLTHSANQVYTLYQGQLSPNHLSSRRRTFTPTLTFST